ncbi:hypothetical protein [Myxosarcina sp. GI1(2024)]
MPKYLMYDFMAIAPKKSYSGRSIVVNLLNANKGTFELVTIP